MDKFQEIANRIMADLERKKAEASTTTNSSSSSQESSKPEPKYRCSACNDTGTILVYEENGYTLKHAKECECQIQRRLQRMFKSSEITPAFQRKTFQNFETGGRPESVRRLYACAKDYADRFEDMKDEENNWMALLGNPGCGKTHLSMAVANGRIGTDTVLYFPHLEGMTEIFEAMRRGSEDDSLYKRLQQMKTVGLLIWDDFFKTKKGEEPKPFEFKIAQEVLNYRYLNLKTTIINSERLPNQLVEIDEALGSRIIERSKPHLVIVTGQESNYRLRD